MKTIFKKIIAVTALLCVALTSLAGCGDGKNVDSTEKVTQYPFEVGEASNNALNDPNDPLDAEDPTAPVDSITGGQTIQSDPEVEEVTEIEAVTDADGQPATEVQDVTDANGETVTDANGEKVTETVAVTKVVTKTVTTPAATQAATVSDYKAKRDGRYAMWLDISKDENFYFENDFIEVTFKVKDTAPDGDYAFTISPDLSDIAGVAVQPSKVLEGTFRVNSGDIAAADVSGETGDLVFYGDNIACKQGDTVTTHINIKNNSGLAAFCIWFYFDSNALEFVSAVPCGSFEEIARNVDSGGAGVVKDQ